MQWIQDIVEKFLGLIEDEQLRKQEGIVVSFGISLLFLWYKCFGVTWMYGIMISFLVFLSCGITSFYYEEFVLFFRVGCWIFVLSAVYGIYKYTDAEGCLSALHRSISTEPPAEGFVKLERAILCEKSMLPKQKEHLDLYHFALLVRNGVYAKARRLYDEKHKDRCGWQFHYQWLCIHQERLVDALAVEDTMEKAVDYDSGEGAGYCDAIRLNRGFVLMSLQRYEEAQDVFAKLCRSERVRRDKTMLATAYNNWIQASFHIKDGRTVSLDEIEERLARYREDCCLGHLMAENRNQWIQFKNDELNAYRQFSVDRNKYDENVNGFLRDVAALSLPMREKCNFLASTARIVRTMGLPDADCRKEILACRNDLRRLPPPDHYVVFRELMAFYEHPEVRGRLSDEEKEWQGEIESMLRQQAVHELESYRLGLPPNAVNAWVWALKEQILVSLNTHNICVEDLISRYGELFKKMRENEWGNRSECCARLDLVHALLREENLSCFKEVCYAKEILEQLSILEKLLPPKEDVLYAEVYLRMVFAYAFLGFVEQSFQYDLRFRSTEVSLDFFTQEYHAKYVFSLVAIRAFFIRRAIFELLENPEKTGHQGCVMDVLQDPETHHVAFLMTIGRLYGLDELCIAKAVWPYEEDPNELERTGRMGWKVHSHTWIILPQLSLDVDVMYPDIGRVDGDCRMVFLGGNHPVGTGQSAFVRREIDAVDHARNGWQPRAIQEHLSYQKLGQAEKALVDLLTGYIVELLPKNLVGTEEMWKYAARCFDGFVPWDFCIQCTRESDNRPRVYKRKHL